MKMIPTQTKKAHVTFAPGAPIITAYSFGCIKNCDGKSVWFTTDGKAYELMYARMSKRYAFVRASDYDMNPFEIVE